MLPRVSLDVSGTTALLLLRFLERKASTLGIAANEVADHAILAWINAQQDACSHTPHGQGYRWKSLFLPEGTRLEVRTRDQAYRARVVGNEVMHEGRALSPNQFVSACAGAARNAWREISLLLPGERYWKAAYLLRKEAEQAQKLALEMAASAAAAGTAVPVAGRPMQHWLFKEPREQRLSDRRSPRGTTDFDDH
jgi:hypothetical protein